MMELFSLRLLGNCICAIPLTLLGFCIHFRPLRLSVYLSTALSVYGNYVYILSHFSLIPHLRLQKVSNKGKDEDTGDSKSETKGVGPCPLKSCFCISCSSRNKRAIVRVSEVEKHRVRNSMKRQFSNTSFCNLRTYMAN